MLLMRVIAQKVAFDLNIGVNVNCLKRFNISSDDP